MVLIQFLVQPFPTTTTAQTSFFLLRIFLQPLRLHAFAPAGRGTGDVFRGERRVRLDAPLVLLSRRKGKAERSLGQTAAEGGRAEGGVGESVELGRGCCLSFAVVSVPRFHLLFAISTLHPSVTSALSVLGLSLTRLPFSVVPWPLLSKRVRFLLSKPPFLSSLPSSPANPLSLPQPTQTDTNQERTIIASRQFEC